MFAVYFNKVSNDTDKSVSLLIDTDIVMHSELSFDINTSKCFHAFERHTLILNIIGTVNSILSKPEILIDLLTKVKIKRILVAASISNF